MNERIVLFSQVPFAYDKKEVKWEVKISKDNVSELRSMVSHLSNRIKQIEEQIEQSITPEVCI